MFIKIITNCTRAICCRIPNGSEKAVFSLKEVSQNSVIVQVLCHIHKSRSYLHYYLIATVEIEDLNYRRLSGKLQFYFYFVFRFCSVKIVPRILENVVAEAEQRVAAE